MIDRDITNIDMKTSQRNKTNGYPASELVNTRWTNADKLECNSCKWVRSSHFKKLQSKASYQSEQPDRLGKYKPVAWFRLIYLG